MATTSAGLSGDNTITGTSGSDKLIGGAGNDIIDGGAGSDFINAGGGDDIIIYDEADYKILGGGGIDTLWFKGSQQKLNLAGNVVNGIEQLWLAGGGGHQVWFTAADIIRVSDTDQTIITGDSSNRIYPGSGWTFGGLTADGQSQVLVNGLAKLIVSLPVYVDGFSGNSTFFVSGLTPLTEDSPKDAITLSVNGSISITDPNAGQGILLGGATAPGSTTGTLAVTLEQAGTNGSPSIYNYTYQIANAAVQSLGKDKPLIDSFIIKTIDGSIKQLDFVTTGVNDPATIGAPVNASVTEDVNVGADGKLTASGILSISDVDTGEASFQTSVTSAPGNLGSLTLAANGSYTYSVDNASVQYLKTGGTKTETFTVKAIDGTTQDITFTINGADDAKSATVTEFSDTNPVENFGAHNVTGTFTMDGAGTGASLDSVQLATIGANSTDKLGSFSAKVISINESGIATVQWWFVAADSVMDELNDIDSIEQSYDIRLTNADGEIHNDQVKITLQGVTDNRSLADATWIGTAGADDTTNNASLFQGNDVMFGLDGDDRLNGFSGKNIIYGGSGDDTFIHSTASTDQFYGGPGNDRVFTNFNDALSLVPYVFFGEEGSDSLDPVGVTGGAQLLGGAGNDSFTIKARPGSSPTIYLWGGSGSDTIDYIPPGSFTAPNVWLMDFDTRAPSLEGDGGDVLKLQSSYVKTVTSGVTGESPDSYLAPGTPYLKISLKTDSTQFSGYMFLYIVGSDITMESLADNIIMN